MLNRTVYQPLCVWLVVGLLSAFSFSGGYAVTDTDPLNLEKIETTQAENTERTQNMSGITAGDVLIFISFSMPEASVWQWLQQAQRADATLVLRGLLNGDLADTQAEIKTVTAMGEGGVVVDPTLFTDYHVTTVPTVVVRNTQNSCPALQDCPHIYPFDSVSGNVGLAAALAAIDVHAADSTLQVIARNALHALRDAP